MTFTFARAAGARLGIVLLALAAPAAHADDAARIEELEQRILVLERKLEIQADDAAAKAKEAATPVAGEKGFGLKSADGSWEIKLKALVQADGRFFTGDPLTSSTDPSRNNNDTFLLRRVEPSFQGSLGKFVGFVFTPQFGESNSARNASVTDVYVDARFDPRATLRVGKAKVPVGLENLQSSGAIAFVERGLPTELVPNRDIGVQLQGVFADGVLSYAVGLFNGAPDGRDGAPNDVDNRKEVALRLFSEPFHNQPGFFQNLGLGIAGTRGEKLGTGNDILPRYRTVGQNQVFAWFAGAVQSSGTTFDPTVFSVGPETRLTPQLYFYRNRFGLLAEYVCVTQELAAATSTTATLPGLPAGGGVRYTNKAWQAVGSFVVTGEDASFKGVKPLHPFTLGGEGWGALEIAARYGVLDVDDDVFTDKLADPRKSVSKESDWGVGINWYATQNLKLVLDYDQTAFAGGFKDPASGALADRPDENAIFGRAQVWF